MVTRDDNYSITLVALLSSIRRSLLLITRVISFGSRADAKNTTIRGLIAAQKQIVRSLLTTAASG